MELYNRLIENPLFFKWIYHSSNEIESYWTHYLAANPDESKLILDFKAQFEKHFTSKNETLSEFEKKALARRIIGELELVDQKTNRFVYIKAAMRYAAVAVLFLTIGGSLVYLFMARENTNFVSESFSATHNIKEPVLIIDNGQHIPLNNEESEIDYSADGGIVINKERVVKENELDENPTMNTVVIPYGNRSVISLSDGTKVWLNAGSRLIYPSKFVDKTREVYLVGEAFFKVEKNEEMPFIVKTSNLSVKVLGTQFNVLAYPEDNSIQTVLTEGSVEVIKANAGLFEKSVRLVPGQMALFNKNDNETKVYEVDVEYYTLWTEGIFSFRNTDLSRLVKKLERYYNIRFDYANPLDGTTKVSGKLDVTKGQQEVFEYLQKLTGLQFSKINEWKYEIK
jgi:hypothetical protein